MYLQQLEKQNLWLFFQTEELFLRCPQTTCLYHQYIL